MLLYYFYLIMFLNLDYIAGGKMKQTTIDFVLPNKIGDSILTIPFLICLDQLKKKYSDDKKIILYTLNDMTKIFQSLALFEVRKLNALEKIKSYFSPPDKAFFLHNTSKNMGLNAKKTYGEILAHKKLVTYDQHLPYLNCTKIQDELPIELLDYLLKEINLPPFAVKYFGILIDIGYTPTQIIETFTFNSESLNPIIKAINTKANLTYGKYIVFCMEAANGSKRGSERRWEEKHYIELSRKIKEELNLNSVFIGIDKKYPIPNNSYMHDLRAKLTLDATAEIIGNSIGYVGNDTGPLHLANIMQKKSIGIYFTEYSFVNYSPIFPEFIQKIFIPDTTGQVFDVIKKLYS